MKNLEGFDSIDDLKKAISQLTQKYEQLKQDERPTKIAEARAIIEDYELTAEELGLSQTTATQKTNVDRPAARRKSSTSTRETPSDGGQQGLW